MKIIAHRGDSGLFPENTLSAFQKAASLPIDGVEMDVQLTKDGYLVVIHDEKINRTSNGKGYVKDMTLAELRQYDFGCWFDDKFVGERIPTLREVLQLFLDTTHQIHIELKTDVFPYEGIEKLVLEEVVLHGMEHRVIISSFDHEILQRIQRLTPKLPVAALFLEPIVDYVTYTSFIPAQMIHISKRIVTRNPSLQYLQTGQLVRVFTVNKVKEAREFEKLGVEAIFTDFPEKMLSYFN